MNRIILLPIFIACIASTQMAYTKTAKNTPATPIIKFVNDKVRIDVFSLKYKNSKLILDLEIEPTEKEARLLYFKILRPSISESGFVCSVSTIDYILPSKPSRMEIEAFTIGNIPLGPGMEIEFSEVFSVFERTKAKIEEDEKEASRSAKIHEDQKKVESDALEKEMLGFPNRIKNAIRNKKIIIGMTPRQLELAWDAPEHINTTVNKSGRMDQWVYGLGRYVYLQNGKVTSWQIMTQ